jgi:hypothetical protein
MSDSWDEEEPDDLDYWRLCDELSIYEAALLTAGHSPGKLSDVERRTTENRPRGYEAAKTAITNALRGGRIKGMVEPEYGSDINGNDYPIAEKVGLNSRVEVDSLKQWLASRGFAEVSSFRKEPKRRTISTRATPGTRRNSQQPCVHGRLSRIPPADIPSRHSPNGCAKMLPSSD